MPTLAFQETIIVRFFAKAHLGTFLSLGLLLGKSASFFSALTSFPLSEINPILPFVAATLLAAFSFSVNVVYLFTSAWLAHGAGIAMEESEMGRLDKEREVKRVQREDEEDESARERLIRNPAPDEGLESSGALTPNSEVAPNLRGADQPLIMSAREAEQVVARKKHVILNDIVKLGDVFWLFLLLNCEFTFTPPPFECIGFCAIAGISTARLCLRIIRVLGYGSFKLADALAGTQMCAARYGAHSRTLPPTCSRSDMATRRRAPDG